MGGFYPTQTKQVGSGQTALLMHQYALKVALKNGPTATAAPLPADSDSNRKMPITIRPEPRAKEKQFRSPSKNQKAKRPEPKPDTSEEPLNWLPEVSFFDPNLDDDSFMRHPPRKSDLQPLRSCSFREEAAADMSYALPSAK